MSVVLNGSSQYLYTLTAPVTAPAFTIACFVKPTSDAVSGVALSVENGLDTSAYRCHSLEVSGAVAGDPVRVYSYDGSTFAIASTTTSYAAGAWQHVCGVFAAANSRSAYLAGGGKGTDTTAKTVTGIDRFLVGVRRYANRLGYFPGKLAEVAVWNTVLSDAQVQNLAAGVMVTTVQPGNLLAYWPLVADANDTIGTNHLTTAGSPSFDAADHPAVGTAVELTGSIAAVSSVAGVLSAGHALSASILTRATVSGDLRESLHRLAGLCQPVSSVAGNLNQAHSLLALHPNPNCVALWRFESGALTADSLGTNTLTNTAVTAETSDVREGGACASFDGVSSKFQIADAGLGAGFPLKSGASSKQVSFACWLRPGSIPVTEYDTILAKEALDGSAESFYFVLETDGFLYLGIGYGISTEWLQETSTVLVAGRWYHVGATWRDADRSYRIRVWDVTAGTVGETTGVATHNLALTTGPLALGARPILGVARPYQGLLDQLVFFKDILTVDEIDQIRQGGLDALIAGGVRATSSVTAGLNYMRRLVGSVTVTSSVAGWLQYRAGTFVPSQVLAEPYPVPMLGQYLTGGAFSGELTPFERGVMDWAAAMGQWNEEHMTRVMRDMARLGQEKPSDWMDA